MSNSNIEGLEAFLRSIENLSTEIEGNISTFVGETAYSIERDAKLLCPVDTGRLRQSITTTYNAGSFKAQVGTNVDYSESVEFGTIRQRPQPYMFPAFIKWKPKFLDGLKDILKRVGD
jgi:HK97 gp10 family phage protein